jgi:hypothetical protein
MAAVSGSPVLPAAGAVVTAYENSLWPLAQIGGQLDARRVPSGFYADLHREGATLNDWRPTFATSRAIKAEGVARQ